VAANAFEGVDRGADVLITFGSAVKRIEFMLTLSRTRPLFRFVFGPAIPLTISAVFLSLYSEMNSWPFKIGLIALAMYVILGIRHVASRKYVLSNGALIDLSGRLTQLRQHFR